jgi:hypothetical protein
MMMLACVAAPETREERWTDAGVSSHEGTIGPPTAGTVSPMTNPNHDEDGGDPVEVWGRRIGRGLAVAVAIGLIIWLLGPYLRSSFMSG